METPTSQPKKFTLKQELFLSAYLGEAKGNASEAARIAGYKNPMQEGSRLLRNDEIRARIEEFLAPKYATAEQVLQELTEVGLSEWRDFLTIKTAHGETVDVRMDLGSKVKSLELLGKYHQLFTDKVEHSGGIDIQIVGVDLENL